MTPGTESLAALQARIDELASDAKSQTMNPRRRRQKLYYQGAHDAYGHMTRLIRELRARLGDA